MALSLAGLRLGEYLPFMLVPVVVYAGAQWYHKFATHREIVAKINSRTLHSRIVPRGAGIVFGTIFVALTLAAWALGFISTPLALGFAFGGAAATAVGFIDDVRGISAARKLGIHCALAVWLLLVWYRPVYAPALAGLSPILRGLALGFLLFVPAWLINLYNFVDGIDGMAIGGAVFICAAVGIALYVHGTVDSIALVVALLGCCCFGFLFLNLPPARMFMGDAGSIFLGYTIAALAIWTILRAQLSIWTWLIVMGYFLGDTTTTTLCRMVLVRHWYGVHRSHAYQNLARVLNSHARVTYGVGLYQLVWLLPLAIWSVRSPERGPLAAALAIAPVVLWTLKYGPRFSSD